MARKHCTDLLRIWVFTRNGMLGCYWGVTSFDVLPAVATSAVKVGKSLLVRRYHLSTFYTDKEIGVAYSYVSAGTALSQVCLAIS